MKNKNSRIQIFKNGLENLDPENLKTKAALLPSEVPLNINIVDYISSKWPKCKIFRDHPSYINGYYRCCIKPQEHASFSSEKKDFLKFHTDMSLHLKPPEFTFVRCVKKDKESGGENLLLHIEDVYEKLKSNGLSDTISILEKIYPLQLSNGTTKECPLLPKGYEEPLRIFDRIGWQIGGGIGKEIENFVNMCSTWNDLHTMINLTPEDVLVFSNHHFLHARNLCGKYNRITDICLVYLQGI